MPDENEIADWGGIGDHQHLHKTETLGHFAVVLEVLHAVIERHVMLFQKGMDVEAGIKTEQTARRLFPHRPRTGTLSL